MKSTKLSRFCLFCDAVSIYELTALSGKDGTLIMNWKLSGRKLSGSNGSIIPAFSWPVWEQRNTSLWTGDGPADIPTEHIPNTNHQCYSHAQRLGRQKTWKRDALDGTSYAVVYVPLLWNMWNVFKIIYAIELSLITFTCLCFHTALLTVPFHHLHWAAVPCRVSKLSTDFNYAMNGAQAISPVNMKLAVGPCRECLCPSPWIAVTRVQNSEHNPRPTRVVWESKPVRAPYKTVTYTKHLQGFLV
jgi:hypothetical protein